MSVLRQVFQEKLAEGSIKIENSMTKDRDSQIHGGTSLARGTSFARSSNSGGSIMESIRRKRWAIAEGYIPAGSHGPSPQMTSRETLCLLNTSDRDAHIRMTVFYSDREPAGPYQLVLPARRTTHIRFNDLVDPEPIPLDTDFAESHRIGYADRRTAHPPGFAPGGKRLAQHHRVRRRRVMQDPVNRPAPCTRRLP